MRAISKARMRLCWVLRHLLAASFLIVWSAVPLRAAFNEIIQGARPQGMGGAFVAVADDFNALYWNPAGLTLFKAGEVGFSHATEFDLQSGDDLTADYAGYGSGPLPYGSWGIALFRHALGEIMQEKSLTFSYGVPVTPITRFGVNVKSLNLSTTPAGNFRPDPAFTDQNAISFDLGFVQILSPEVRFGFMARNLGGQLGVVKTEAATRSYRMGLAVNLDEFFLPQDSLTMALDLATRKDIDDKAGTKVIPHVGIEYSPVPYAAFRAGVDDGRLAAGLSFSAFSFTIDYAYTDEEVGSTQLISASYRFESHIDVKEVHHRAAAAEHH